MSGHEADSVAAYILEFCLGRIALDEKAFTLPELRAYVEPKRHVISLSLSSVLRNLRRRRVLDFDVRHGVYHLHSVRVAP